MRFESSICGRLHLRREAGLIRDKHNIISPRLAQISWSRLDRMETILLKRLRSGVAYTEYHQSNKSSYVKYETRIHETRMLETKTHEARTHNRATQSQTQNELLPIVGTNEVLNTAQQREPFQPILIKHPGTAMTAIVAPTLAKALKTDLLTVPTYQPTPT